jgi:CRP-like cAMP-binding protein
MNTRDALRGVPWLSSVPDAELVSLAAEAEQVKIPAGQPILAELEVGDALHVLLDGEAAATVAAGEGQRREVGKLCAGDACGEIALLTQQLHSATVTARTDVAALRIPRAAFEKLMARHPSIAVHFARLIAKRVADTDAALDSLLDESGKGERAAEQLAGQTDAVVRSANSIARAWRELVLTHRRELPFFALTSFIATLLAVRACAFVLAWSGAGLFGFLRFAYTLGIILVMVSTAVSLLRFRPRVQRTVALAYGIGFALILNELSVFLAFDIFYLDMTTPDPNLVFDIETLYRRTESRTAITAMIAFLLLLTFLRRFLRRTAFVLRARIAAIGRSP